MAGYGNYRGTSALALGVAHYRNESLMMHAGMSWAGGSSHMMANAGVTWKLGHRDPETAIADRYRRGPISSAYARWGLARGPSPVNLRLDTKEEEYRHEKIYLVCFHGSTCFRNGFCRYIRTGIARSLA